ncbi:uncharacterized protein VP01_3563g3 [Puccinia sorghi]|uniref:Retrovirus-related Pol polyprotein from transposon TNT 1-94-like beta-barrel domain-containing protein n=1 Tax=Puccinia sorghi TaxID=27349 RepID=A0A0L6UW61_9BASI|nr:uncharacterized protein VP01_3563g3 [Puccinia sorghi]
MGVTNYQKFATDTAKDNPRSMWINLESHYQSKAIGSDINQFITDLTSHICNINTVGLRIGIPQDLKIHENLFCESILGKIPSHLVHTRKVLLQNLPQPLKTKAKKTAAIEGDSSDFSMAWNYVKRAQVDKLSLNTAYLDGGASHHMISDWDMFTTYLTDTNCKIELADGQTVICPGMGNIYVKTKSGQSLNLECLHVPQLVGNLISKGHLFCCSMDCVRTGPLTAKMVFEGETLFQVKLAKNDVFLIKIEIVKGKSNLSLKSKSDNCSDIKLSSKYLMEDLGPLKHLLGMKMEKVGSSIWLSQDLYIKKILTSYGMLESRTVETLLVPNTRLLPASMSDREEFEKLNINYRQIVGLLNYLSVSTCPDIAFAMSQLSQFLESPGIAHWNTCVHLLQYLSKTPTCGITLGASILPIKIFTDADYTNDKTTSHSYFGYVMMMGNGVVSWKSKKRCESCFSPTL